jgi:hypothetical protein
MKHSQRIYRDSKGKRYVLSFTTPTIVDGSNVWSCKVTFIAEDKTKEIEDQSLFTGKGKDSLESFLKAYSKFYSYAKNVEDDLRLVFADGSEVFSRFDMMLYNTDLTDEFCETLHQELTNEISNHIKRKYIDKSL